MKERKNLTISPAILKKADDLIAVMHTDDLSGLVAALVREEWERRNGKVPVNHHQAAFTPPAAKPFRKQGKSAA